MKACMWMHAFIFLRDLHTRSVLRRIKVVHGLVCWLFRLDKESLLSCLSRREIQYICMYMLVLFWVFVFSLFCFYLFVRLLGFERVCIGCIVIGFCVRDFSTSCTQFVMDSSLFAHGHGPFLSNRVIICSCIYFINICWPFMIDFLLFLWFVITNWYMSPWVDW